MTVQLQCNSSSKVIESVNYLRYGTQPLPPPPPTATPKNIMNGLFRSSGEWVDCITGPIIPLEFNKRMND